MDPQFRAIPVAELHFDPENPRIPPGLDAEDDRAVLDWMLADAGLVELMGSLAANGYFPAEPLLVMPRDDLEHGGYWVLEGNRRLAAVRLLLNPEMAPKRRRAVESVAAEVVDRDALRELPCAVFGDRKSVLDYLGFRHVTGIKQWEPAAKARYLDALYREHVDREGDSVYRHIARIIGSRADYVSRLIVSLRLYEQMQTDPTLKKLGLEDSEISFSLLTLALNYASLLDFLGIRDSPPGNTSGLDPDALRNLGEWMFVDRVGLGRTQLGESRNMKLLALAVADPRGRNALEAGNTVEEAAQAALDADALFDRSLRQIRTQLTSAQGLIHRVRVLPTHLETLEEIEDIAEQLMMLARRRARATDV